MDDTDRIIQRAALPEILLVSDLAPALKLSEVTVRRWIRTGLIPGRRLARRWIVRKEDLLFALAPTGQQRSPAVTDDPWGSECAVCQEPLRGMAGGVLGDGSPVCESCAACIDDLREENHEEPPV